MNAKKGGEGRWPRAMIGIVLVLIMLLSLFSILTASGSDVTQTTVRNGCVVTMYNATYEEYWDLRAVSMPIMDLQLKDLIIDENGEFSKEIDTANITAFSIPGSVRLKAYLDRAVGVIGPAETDVGSVAILVVHTDLTAELSTDSVARSDEFTISGTATGSTGVDIVVVAPKGSSGSMIDPSGTPLLTGTTMYHAATSVSDVDYTFTKKIHVGDDVDAGSYLVVVLSKGRDDDYGSGYDNLTAALATYNLTARTQEHILEILADATIDVAGSDDLMWTGHINVIPSPCLHVNMSKSAVPLGESFEVYGTALSDYVELVAISPKGGNGTGLDGFFGVSVYPVPVFEGTGVIHSFEKYPGVQRISNESIPVKNNSFPKTIPVSGCAPPTPAPGRGGGGRARDSDGDGWSDSYELRMGWDPYDPCSPDPECDACLATSCNVYKRIKVDSEADTGNYTIFVLSSGENGVYGNSFYKYIDSILDLDGAGPEPGAIDVSTKTQEEIISIINDATIDQAGSDDLLWHENIVVTQLGIFDTGESTNPYPSISGTHNGTITPYYDINVSTLYTYPCPGTGGHTEYAAFYNAATGEAIANVRWNGYQGDYRHIEFDPPFTLHAKVTYNYTIKTGSYPQIIHAESKNVTGGVITCTEFIDANGRRYRNWIPAITLV